MRYLVNLAVTILFLSLAACSKDSSPSQEADQRNLNRQREKIEEIAASMPCTNAEDWEFTAIGSKACGGPTGYIAYSTQIDTVDFLNRVERYSDNQAEFNQRWGIASDCSLPPTPIDVVCENGGAVLVF